MKRYRGVTLDLPGSDLPLLTPQPVPPSPSSPSLCCPQTNALIPLTKSTALHFRNVNSRKCFCRTVFGRSWRRRRIIPRAYLNTSYDYRGTHATFFHCPNRSFALQIGGQADAEGNYRSPAAVSRADGGDLLKDANRLFGAQTAARSTGEEAAGCKTRAAQSPTCRTPHYRYTTKKRRQPDRCITS